MMAHIEESPNIDGLLIARLKVFADKRGSFLEYFRKDWFPDRSWDRLQTNRSVSKAGVLRGLHYHFHQVDYWYVQTGKIRAGLADLRPSSPTYLATQIIEMGGDNQIGLFIPIGVAHGFLALTDAIHTYIVDNYYDGGQDEFGIAWNDPDLGLNWDLAATPLLSARDAANKRLRDIPENELPK